jgi:hypothetical protein
MSLNQFEFLFNKVYLVRHCDASSLCFNLRGNFLKFKIKKNKIDFYVIINQGFSNCVPWRHI